MQLVEKKQVSSAWLLSRDQIGTGAGFASSTELSVKTPARWLPLFSCERPFHLAEDAPCLNATMKPGSVGKGFSIACHVRSCASTDYGGCHHPTRLQRVRERNGVGVGGVWGGTGFCFSIGTGSSSGNSSTCHHDCMLLKSVRQGRLCSAGGLQATQQQPLERRHRWQQTGRVGWACSLPLKGYTWGITIDPREGGLVSEREKALSLQFFGNEIHNKLILKQ